MLPSKPSQATITSTRENAQAMLNMEKGEKFVMGKNNTNPSKRRARATCNRRGGTIITLYYEMEEYFKNHARIHTAAISSRSSLDRSGAIFTSKGGGPSSPHCISSRAA